MKELAPAHLPPKLGQGKLRKRSERKLEEPMAQAAKKDEQIALFEGYEVAKVITKFRGTVEIEGIGVLKPYENVRLEVVAKIVDTRHPDDDGSLNRVQILKPISVEVVEQGFKLVQDEDVLPDTEDEE